MDVIGGRTSFPLQYGVPLEVLVPKLAHTRFEPSGFTRDPDVPIAQSVVDDSFRWLGIQFVPGYREQHAPQRPQEVAGGAPEVEEAEEAVTALAVPAAAVRSKTLAYHEIEPRPLAIQGDETVRWSSTTRHAGRQSDAPACADCGAIMIRTGSCATCTQCGSTSGCG